MKFAYNTPYNYNPSQCKRAVQYVVNIHPQVPLDDLKGTKEDPCLVVQCSTDLALKVLNTNPAAFSIATVPTLMEQGITKYKVSYRACVRVYDSQCADLYSGFIQAPLS